MSERWYSYDCSNPQCVKGTTGVVLDVRLDDEARNDLPPVILCPLCQTPMDFNAQWLATAGGFGSRGDGGYEAARQDQMRFIALRYAVRDVLDSAPIWMETMLSLVEKTRTPFHTLKTVYQTVTTR